MSLSFLISSRYSYLVLWNVNMCEKCHPEKLHWSVWETCPWLTFTLMRTFSGRLSSFFLAFSFGASRGWTGLMMKKRERREDGSNVPNHIFPRVHLSATNKLITTWRLFPLWYFKTTNKFRYQPNTPQTLPMSVQIFICSLKQANFIRIHSFFTFSTAGFSLRPHLSNQTHF